MMDKREQFRKMLTKVASASKIAEGNESLQRVLNQVFYSILRVDLIKDTAHILHSIDFPGYVLQEVIWSDYLAGYQRFIKMDSLDEFKSENLLELYLRGQKSLSTEIPYKHENASEWLMMEVIFETEDDTPHAIVTVRKSTRDHLLRSIIDTYVYDTCDYFIYLDMKNNSYTMFSHATNGTPLPAAECEDYEAETVTYTREFVYEEDQEKVIHEMSLKRIREGLESKKVHAFSCGIKDEVRGYTRKRLEYRYYDRENQMVLLTRTDITDEYMNEKSKRQELQSALERARTDGLTGLLNRQGITDGIIGCLKSEEKVAILFIDLDNFKSVNDIYGHDAGDKLLCKVAATIRKQVRTTDMTGRLGGDEFLVCLRGVQSVEEVRMCGERICKAVIEIKDAHVEKISCSIGATISPDDAMEYTDLMKVADRRAYLAKSRGKNQVCLD